MGESRCLTRSTELPDLLWGLVLIQFVGGQDMWLNPVRVVKFLVSLQRTASFFGGPLEGTQTQLHHVWKGAR